MEGRRSARHSAHLWEADAMGGSEFLSVVKLCWEGYMFSSSIPNVTPWPCTSQAPCSLQPNLNRIIRLIGGDHKISQRARQVLGGGEVCGALLAPTPSSAPGQAPLVLKCSKCFFRRLCPPLPAHRPLTVPLHWASTRPSHPIPDLTARRLSPRARPSKLWFHLPEEELSPAAFQPM
jgi:hypothetical protein